MIAADYRAAQAKIMTEAELQDHVIALANDLGWLWFHDQDSRRNNAGLPDLILVRNGRLIFAELKTAKGHVRPDQQRWIEALTTVSHRSPMVNVYLWRPCDLVSGLIAGVLR